MAAAVRAAASGSAWLSPRAAEAVLGEIRRSPIERQPGDSALGELTAREIDVLRLVAHGLENAQIAERLDIAGIADTLDPLFAVFAKTRLSDEGFGDFCHRLGRDRLAQVLAETMKGVA